MMSLPRTILIEAGLFISYLTGDDLEPLFSRVVEALNSGDVEAFASSEVYDDVISALRSQRIPLEKTLAFVADMRSIPHKALPVSVEIAAEALRTYIRHGGPRKLHYFDSYHVATARNQGLPLLTSDRYIVGHAEEMGVRALDVRKVGKM